MEKLLNSVPIFTGSCTTYEIFNIICALPVTSFFYVLHSTKCEGNFFALAGHFKRATRGRLVPRGACCLCGFVVRVLACKPYNYRQIDRTVRFTVIR